MPTDSTPPQTTPRTIALVASNLPPVVGGSSVVYDSLARNAHGRVVAIAPKTNYVDGTPLEGWRQHDAGCGYEVRRLPLVRPRLSRPPGYDLVSKVRHRAATAVIRAAVLASALRTADNGTGTVCVGETAANGWLLETLRHLPSIRTMAYVHGEELTTRDAHDPDRSRCRSRLMAADAVIAVSNFTAETVEEILGARHGRRIILIENGVDNERFTPGRRRGDLVERYGLRDAFVFVSICRLLEKKGVDRTIDAFASITAGMPAARLLIVGDGPYAETLRAQAAASGVGERIRFTGRIPGDELPDHHRLADVFVMPNRRMPDGDTEGFGLVFLEANACGVPVIAGRDGGSTAAVTNGMNGLIVNGDDAGAVAAAMMRLGSDVSLRSRLTAGGLRMTAAAGWGGKAEAFIEAADALHSQPRPQAGDDVPSWRATRRTNEDRTRT